MGGLNNPSIIDLIQEHQLLPDLYKPVGDMVRSLASMSRDVIRSVSNG